MFIKKITSGNNVEYYKKVLLNIKNFIEIIKKNEENVWEILDSKEKSKTKKVLSLLKRNNLKTYNLMLNILYFQEKKDFIENDNLRHNVERLQSVISKQMEFLEEKVLENKILKIVDLKELMDGNKVEDFRSEVSSLIHFIEDEVNPKIDEALSEL